MSEETRVALLPWPSIILEPRGEVFGTPTNIRLFLRLNLFQVEMKGKGKLLTYWLLREESPPQEQIEEEESIVGESRDFPIEDGKRPTADWDNGASMYRSPDGLVDNLRGYETVEESEEIHNNVEDWKQGHESAREEFHNRSEVGSVHISVNNTVQNEDSKEGQSEVSGDVRCADRYFVVSETEIEEECTNL